MVTKRIVGIYALLLYSNFIEEFIVHIDYSKTRTMGLSIQNRNPIDSYLCKLTL